jgi:hypothetical protein
MKYYRYYFVVAYGAVIFFLWQVEILAVCFFGNV